MFVLSGVYGAGRSVRKASNTSRDATKIDTGEHNVPSLLCGALRLNRTRVLGFTEPLCVSNKYQTVFAHSTLLERPMTSFSKQDLGRKIDQ